MLANTFESAASAWNVDSAAFPRRGEPVDKLRFLLRYAILAPSNHNTQPWAFRFQGDQFDLIADRTRSLASSDPFDRELVISCGVFLAFFEMAAHAFGCLLRIERFPERGNQDVLARIALRSHEPGDPNETILRAIVGRRTCRHAFDARPLTEQQKKLLALAADPNRASIAWIDALEDRRSLVQMIMDADRIQFDNPSFLRETASWLRAPNTSAFDGIPSSSIGISGVASYVAPLVVRTFDVGKGKAAKDQELIDGSPAIAVFSTPFDTERDWLACGEALGGFLLYAEQLGLKASYLNQPCEVGEVRFRLSLLDEIKNYPQLVVRVGFLDVVLAPTPRRPLSEFLRAP